MTGRADSRHARQMGKPRASPGTPHVYPVFAGSSAHVRACITTIRENHQMSSIFACLGRRGEKQLRRTRNVT
jgi:hypothetical protein